jgi:hypothetical protein
VEAEQTLEISKERGSLLEGGGFGAAVKSHTVWRKKNKCIKSTGQAIKLVLGQMPQVVDMAATAVVGRVRGICFGIKTLK